MEEIDRFKINYLTKPTAKRLQNNARQWATELAANGGQMMTH